MIDIEFSEPVSVMHSEILDYLEVALVDGLYEPPIKLDTLAKALRVNPTHASAIEFKRNTLAFVLELDPMLSLHHVKCFIQDYLTFGNGYFQVIRERYQQTPVGIKHLPALYMRRRGGDLGYTYKPSLYDDKGRINFRKEQVFHLAEYDIAQEIYGLPSHVSALTSIWLNEDATLFRRQYYRNGSHAGYLLFVNDPNMTKTQEDEFKRRLGNTKGQAFRNIFINGKGSMKEPPELKPIGHIEAKDAFLNLTKQTTSDILTIHRVPLELMSIRREGITSSNDLNKVDWLFHKNELLPLAESLLQINQFVGKEVIKIKPYTNLDSQLAD
ncbi:phage portal protein [Vibrio vulnificus]|uniref:phage portal protein n=1 Tax=Vibrio vulnificus TaxID=672 RepID=UPI00102A76DF|nr:phage portal protein [Vibrio vulnificus]RZP89596.1 phage portal protein [Vibrio vulnificus]RZR41898.1 phage portal protein [Vibrio vulnificus]